MRGSSVLRGTMRTTLQAIIAALTLGSSATATAQSVSAPSAGTFATSTRDQAVSGFVISGFGASDVLYVTIALQNPPSGTTLRLPTTSGLTAASGYTISSDFTRLSFTGSMANANAALATLRVNTGATAGNVQIDVTAAVNAPNYFYLPATGNYYLPVRETGSSFGAGDAGYLEVKRRAAAQTFKGKTGYLVTITSQEEQNFITANVPGNDILIALTDRSGEGTWTWDDGPEAGTVTRIGNQPGTDQSGKYNAWCGGEPNNWGSGENYTVTKWGGGNCWNDFGPPASNTWGSVSGYVIEFGTGSPDQTWSGEARGTVTSVISNVPTQLTLSTPADVTAGGTRATYTVTRRNAAGVAAAPASAQTVYLTASGSSGSFHDALSGGTAITSVTIAANQSAATFYFTATTAGSYTVTAADASPANGATGLADATDAIAVAAGAAARLVIATQPSAAVVVGNVLATQPAVRLRDTLGNDVAQAGVVVTVTIASGDGTIGGTTTATTNASGIATFSGLSMLGAAGTRTLQFTASVGGPALTAATSNAITVSPAAPTLTVAPSLSGTTAIGDTLRVNTGTWAGTPTPSLTVQWQRCDAAGANCTDITGATATLRVLADADHGAKLRARVRAQNDAGSAEQTTAVSAAVTGTAPSGGTVSIAGGTLVGDTLRLTAGAWAGKPAPTVTFRWERCVGESCTAITGATGTTYVVTAADTGRALRAVVRATNAEGSAEVASTRSSAARQLPEAPQAVTIAAGDHAVDVTWRRPAHDGSATVTGYVVDYSSDRGATWRRAADVSGAEQGSLRVTGLENSFVYRVRVAAVSSVGTGPFATSASDVAPNAPVALPSTGTRPALTPGQQVAVQGTSEVPLTRQVVRDTIVELRTGDFALGMSALDAQSRARTIDPSVGSLKLTQAATVRVEGHGFRPGTVVHVWLFSEPRRIGQADVRDDGTFSATLPVPTDITLGEHTLQANGVSNAGTEQSISTGVIVDEAARIAPNAPSAVTATPLDAGAQVSWTAPVYAGGDAVSQYVIEVSRDGGTTWTEALTVAASAGTSARVSGLTNDVAYVTRVTAVNATGRSAPSAASAAVTPFKPRPQLSVRVVESKPTPALGDTVTFTVTVRNTGNGAATNAVLPLPDEPRLRRLAATATCGTVDVVAGRWQIGTLEINAEAVLTLQVVVQKGQEPDGGE